MTINPEYESLTLGEILVKHNICPFNEMCPGDDDIKGIYGRNDCDKCIKKYYPQIIVKQCIEQEIVERTTRIADNTKEDFNTFVLRVANIAEHLIGDGKLINISYPNTDIAIIIYQKNTKEINHGNQNV